MKAYFLSSPQVDPEVQRVINRYCDDLREKTDDELKAIVARERKCRGWGSQRSYFLAALRQVCGERGVAYCWSDTQA